MLLLICHNTPLFENPDLSLEQTLTMVAIDVISLNAGEWDA
jgi:hypothetical protein